MEVVFALVIALLTTGEVQHVLVKTADMAECKSLVQAFVAERMPETMRDARITCIATPVDPLRGSRSRPL